MFATTRNVFNITKRYATSIPINNTALTAFKKSCYYQIDYKIDENSCAREIATKMTAYNIGCLAVVQNNKVVGVVSERDYISKIASLGRNDLEIKVKDICTYGPNIIVATENDSLNTCMQKMMFKDIRHLLIVNKDDVVGMISIKDLIKEIEDHKNTIITKLTDLHMGKGAYFSSE